MLDDVTKKRINSLRQILVGKLPDPKAQVEQITNGLIYKFMNDMDEQSVSMGGKSTYFSGKFQKYSWKNLLDTKTSGVEKIKLYSEAIEQMYTNENLPELFREIFKNSFLPFKDPATLNMFLKEINEFHYSNSEKLGDAFEYLLSFMGSQGDAGQFRTPRHIIDFITEIVNPQKNETVLDPACGTAGFLISSYKHILKQNTKKNLGDGLSASDRKKIGTNLNGYDISPDMVKMSLVNMYLHKFTNPKINEYDTLSSEDRWNEYYDVILANPPFFSPKGGIMPHNRFSVKSTKAEILFIDYIYEHLKPNGRAGIIVPEGLIFQTGTAYKQLRKKLIETSLIGVISLPAGVFQPYSNVQTSILILDKKIQKQIDKIYFFDVKADGYSLNTNRNPIDKNDLPLILEDIDKIQNTKTNKNFKYSFIDKNKLDEDFVLKPFLLEASQNSKFDLKKIDEICEIGDGNHSSNYPTNAEMIKNGIPFIRSVNFKNGKIVGDLKYISEEKHKILKKGHLKIGDILLTNRGVIGKVAIVDERFKVANLNSQIVWLRPKENIINGALLKYLLISDNFQKRIRNLTQGSTLKQLTIKNLKIQKLPIPSIKTQNQIVEELDSYQKIIDGCRQILENYKPSIDIDPSWDVVELNNICDVRDGTHDSPKYVNEGYPLVTSKNVINGSISFEKVNFINQKDFEDINKRSKVDIGDILMPMIGTIGRPTIVKTKTEFAIKNVALIKTKNKISQEYVRLILDSKLFETYLKYNQAGSTQKFLSLGAIRKFKFPIPPKNIEKKLIENINEEELIVSKNKNLIDIFQRRINNKTDNMWTN